MHETSGNNKLNMASHQELYPYCVRNWALLLLKEACIQTNMQTNPLALQEKRLQHSSITQRWGIYYFLSTSPTQKNYASLSPFSTSFKEVFKK
jgi:hypothetical protein